MGKSFNHITLKYKDNSVWSVDCEEHGCIAEVEETSGAITWFDEDAKKSPSVNEAIKAFMRI